MAPGNMRSAVRFARVVSQKWAKSLLVKGGIPSSSFLAAHSMARRAGGNGNSSKDEKKKEQGSRPGGEVQLRRVKNRDEQKR